MSHGDRYLPIIGFRLWALGSGKNSPGAQGPKPRAWSPVVTAGATASQPSVRPSAPGNRQSTGNPAKIAGFPAILCAFRHDAQPRSRRRGTVARRTRSRRHARAYEVRREGPFAGRQRRLAGVLAGQQDQPEPVIHPPVVRQAPPQVCTRRPSPNWAGRGKPTRCVRPARAKRGRRSSTARRT